jgi:hypothetical protein
MSDKQIFPPDIQCRETGCTEEPVCFLGVRQTDFKPMLKALAGLCFFFGAMVVIAALGAMVVIAVESLARLF